MEKETREREKQMEDEVKETVSASSVKKAETPQVVVESHAEKDIAVEGMDLTETKSP